MDKKRTVLLLALSFILTILLFSKSDRVFAQESDAEKEVLKYVESDYVIGPKDVVEITVYGEPDLHKVIQVDSAGNINYPLLGNIEISGLNVSEAASKLERLLGEDFLVSPQVNLLITEYRSKKIYVLGAVESPGVYELKGRSTIMEMISNAGGLSSDAGNSLVLIKADSIKKDPGVDKSGPITVNLERLLTDGDINLNLAVQDGDIIHIPKSDSVYVFGQVNHPGLYKLEEKGMSVLQAITRAGGLTRIAAPNRSRVIRVENGEEKTIPIKIQAVIEGNKNEDISLKSGDIVIVPESYF